MALNRKTGRMRVNPCPACFLLTRRRKPVMANFIVESQFPRPRIEVIKPDGAIVWLKPDYSGFSPDKKSIASQNLLNYTFSEAVDDLMGNFSFSIENEMTIKPGSGNQGTSLFDLIPLRSVVNIYEHEGENPVFRGIIRRRCIGATITSNGVKKSVIFSGKSIISCITEFMVPLDIRIPGVSSAVAKTKSMQSELGQNEMTIKEFMEKTWEYFREVSDEVSQGSGYVNGRLLEIIDNDKFIGNDFILVSGDETHLQYPVATMFYNQANNYITDVWSNILPKPVYEMFTRFDVEHNKPVIVARQVPYGDPDNGNKDWLSLEPYRIDPVSLTAYNLEQSDEDVYTAFNSYVIGSPKAKEFYRAVSDTADYDSSINKDKSAVYGFRLLSVSFTGFDRMENENAEREEDELTKTLSKLNARLEYWFSRIDEMYSGTITLTTNFKDISKNPKAGCRAIFMGGEFYIEKSVHSWNYGGTPLNVLTVSRGMVYDDQGKIKEQIPGIGKLYRELE
jgi:hypothetical protein